MFEEHFSGCLSVFTPVFDIGPVSIFLEQSRFWTRSGRVSSPKPRVPAAPFLRGLGCRKRQVGGQWAHRTASCHTPLANPRWPHRALVRGRQCCGTRLDRYSLSARRYKELKITIAMLTRVALVIFLKIRCCLHNGTGALVRYLQSTLESWESLPRKRCKWSEPIKQSFRVKQLLCVGVEERPEGRWSREQQHPRCWRWSGWLRDRGCAGQAAVPSPLLGFPCSAALGLTGIVIERSAYDLICIF